MNGHDFVHSTLEVSNKNISKSDKHFEDWLNQAFPSKAEQTCFLMQNHINLNESLSFSEFLDSASSRRAVLKNEFMKILYVAVAAIQQGLATTE